MNLSAQQNICYQMPMSMSFAKMTDNNADVEIWRDVVGYEGSYKISNKGRLLSVSRITMRSNGSPFPVKEQILKFEKQDGYNRIRIKRNGFKGHEFVHVMVAKAFILNPENKPQVNHKNAIRNDNRVENLEWATSSENQKYRFAVMGQKSHIFGRFGKLHHNSKPIIQLDKNGDFIREWDSQSDVERALGIYQGSISASCKKPNNFAGGFKWKFKNT